jgi:VWFA-related protein
VASLRQDARHLVWLLAGLLAPGAWAATVRVENPAGRTTVHAVMGAEKVDVRVLPRGRAVRPDDVKRTEQPDLLLLQCRPADGAVIDLEITLPHTSSLEVVTQSGTISLDGLIRDADLTTGSGDVELTMPWELMRISVISGTVPKDFFAPKIDGLEFLAQPLSPYWTLRDRPTSRNSPAVPMRRQAPRVWRTGSEGRLELIADTRSFTYGEIRVTAKSIGRLDLAGARLPADSWVKPPKLAAAALEAIAGKPSGEPAAAAAPKPEPAAAQGDMPLFVSQVRMVNLAVSVVDREGHPAQGLQPEDFEVLENGVPQKISVARPEDVPFNLVLLLDLSGSTVQDRPAMMEAAKRFVQLARPGDRAAIYIMEQDLLDVISPLTGDRERLLRLIETMPPLGGGTPLYNVIALSLVQESLHSSEDRSALVVITDGRENMPREPDALVGSAVSFEALRDAVAKSPVLLYPILLHASDSFMNSNREKMQQLAQASGGRSFSAESIRDLDPVYPLVAEELRSVYGVTYYPENQDFDGRWRRLEVRLKRPGFTLRTREGYYAR